MFDSVKTLKNQELLKDTKLVDGNITITDASLIMSKGFSTFKAKIVNTSDQEYHILKLNVIFITKDQVVESTVVYDKTLDKDEEYDINLYIGKSYSDSLVAYNGIWSINLKKIIKV